MNVLFGTGGGRDQTSLLLFIHLKPEILSENIFKPLFTSLHLVAPSNLSSTLIHSTE